MESLVDLPEVRPPVMADHRRVVQVLDNLSANAARYAPESTPILRFVPDAPSAAGCAPPLTGTTHDLPRIIRTETRRLVLLDPMLPDIDGIELMRQVPELADLPVIFISAYRRDETVAKALESAAADYIVKPFSPTELVAWVRAALRRREAPEPLVLDEPSTTSSAE